MQTETGKADVLGRDRLRHQRPVIEEIGIVGNVRRLTVLDQRHLHRFLEIGAAMEELHLVGQSLVDPDRCLGTEADVAILIVGEIFQNGRQAGVRRLVGFLGKGASDLGHRRTCERSGHGELVLLSRRPRRGGHAGRNHDSANRRQRPRQKVTAINHGIPDRKVHSGSTRHSHGRGEQRAKHQSPAALPRCGAGLSGFPKMPSYPVGFQHVMWIPDRHDGA